MVNVFDWCRVMLLVALLSISPFLRAESPETINADAIKRGCVTRMERDYLMGRANQLSSPDYNILFRWSCRSGENSIVDRYEIDGSSPEIVTIVFWRGTTVLVLVKWSVNSQASDYEGDFYQVFAYMVSQDGSTPSLKRAEDLMGKFGSGWDGERNGTTVKYPYKNAAAIRNRLNQLEKSAHSKGSKN